jgi:type IV pilus assembly protein PilC
LMAFTNFITSAWLLMVAGLGIAVVIAIIGLRTTRGRYLWHRLLLRLPVLGDTVQYMLVERYCRILASMLTAGVVLTEAMTVARESLRNLVYDRKLRVAYEQMLQGGGLAAPLQQTGLFPRTATQMLRVGEETGTLDTQVTVAAEYFERELDYKVKKVTTLIEPLVIIVAGGIVGFVAIALVSAMYGIFREVHVS